MEPPDRRAAVPRKFVVGPPSAHGIRRPRAEGKEEVTQVEGVTSSAVEVATTKPRGPVVSTLVIVAVGGTIATLGLMIPRTSYDIWGGLLIGPILLLTIVPLAVRTARREHNPAAGRIVLLAALAKLSVGTVARYIVTYGVYHGTADAESYFTTGMDLAPQFKRGDFSNLGSISGTHFIEVLSGVVQAIIGQTRLGEFVVFSWFGFLGLYFMYQAFRIAFPEGDLRRYRWLVFFWPSVVYWPSGIGKDAWIAMALGMMVLGIANLYVGRWRGVWWLAAGTFASAIVRPHITLLVFAAFGVGLVLRRSAGPGARLLARPAGTLILVVGMLLASLVLFAQTASFFKLDSLDVSSAQDVLAKAELQTSEGGSSFTAPDPTSVQGYIAATVTVMFRPFPYEAGSGAAMIAGGEGLLLIALVFLSLRRISRFPALSLRHAYIAFAGAYCAAFIFAFSSINNFGILARERGSQFFPILFIILAIPKRRVRELPPRMQLRTPIRHETAKTASSTA